MENETVMGRDELQAALQFANIPTLLMVLVQLTGDLAWLEPPYRPRPAQGWDHNDDGGLPSEAQAVVRAAALEAITEWQAGRPMALPQPSDDLLVRMLSVAMGETIPAEYGPMMADDMASREAGGLVPSPLLPADGVPADELSVAVIGAGMSGICAAVALGQAGLRYTVFESGDKVGGVWRANKYPGAGVDTPSHLYSYSFAQNDWTQYFALGEEIRDYFEKVAHDFGVMPNVRLGHRVESARYDEERQAWTLTVAGPQGREQVAVSFLISAVGAFNTPSVPAIDGLDSFAGPSFHTAEWPEDLNWAGQRIGVIGTGASAMQAVPRLAEEAASLTIFQRSPQWIAPFPDFMKKVPAEVRHLLMTVGPYQWWYRMRLAWTHNDKLFPSLQKDPGWPFKDRALNPINNGHRRHFTRYAVNELQGREDLISSVVPSYPPFGKRMLIDNGWFEALRRDNVRLVTDRIGRVTATGVAMESGTQHDLDVLVLATGFRVAHFLSTFDLVGRGGRRLAETWDGDDARMYLGAMVPGYPNFFALYGPSTQPGHGGSIIEQVEFQVNYLMNLLGQMLKEGIGAVDIRPEIYDEYNDELDRAHQKMIWTHPGVETYYRNSKGRVLVTPTRVVDFWKLTREADLSEFHTEARR